jgi:hypothetical protein
MALRPTTYRPLVEPEMFEPLLPEPENMGGPARAVLPAAPPVMVKPAPVIPAAPAPLPVTSMVIPQAPPPPPPAPPPPPVTPQFADLFPNGLDQETLGALLSTAPGAVVSPAASQPGPGAGLVTTPGGGQGFYFYTDKGRLAGYDGKGGFIAVDPNAQYRLWDERGDNKVIVSGTGQDALQQIYNTANQFNTEQGNKANWGIERLNPATGKWERIAENDPAKNIGGKIADIALPVAGAILLPGVGGALGGALGAGLGAAGGSALSSIAQGRSLEDTLLRAGISGVAAGGLSAVGGAPFLGATQAPTQAVTQTAAEVGLQAGTQGLASGASQSLAPVVIDAAGNLILTGAREAATGALGSALGSAAGSALGSLVSAPTAPAQPTPAPEPTPEIVVTPTPETPPLNIVAGALPGAGAALPAVIPETIGNPIEVVEQRPVEERPAETPPIVPPVNPLIPETIGNPIDVVRPRPAPPSGINLGPIAPALPNLIPSGVPTPDITPEIVVPGKRPTSFDLAPVAPIAPVLPNLIPSSVPTPDVTPEIVVTGERPPLPEGFDPGPIAPVLPNLIPNSVPTPNLNGNSLLDEIIKYYTLGSGALDLLGGALGGGGAATTPYVSQLGPAPAFSRGAFTPFTGDYETYGFGPEFNFFGGAPAPAPTPTAPDMSILPPRANPNWGGGIV